MAHLSVESGHLPSQAGSPWQPQPEISSHSGPRAGLPELAEEGSPQTGRRVGADGWQSASVKDGQSRGSACDGCDEMPVSSEENCLLEVNILLASLKPQLPQGPERLVRGSPHLWDRWEIWPLMG